MTRNSVEFLAPLAAQESSQLRRPKWGKKLPWGFLACVVLPTILASIYYGLIAAPQYVSEARFIVRSPSEPQASTLGFALQGVGLASNQTDAFAIHEFIASRDGLEALASKVPLEAILSRPRMDFIARYPRIGQGRNKESLFEAYSRIVTVGYDATSGISTLRVQSFSPRDTQLIASTLLANGEELINRLNDRAYQNAIGEAAVTVIEAQARLVESQRRLSEYRNREQFIDPARSATETSQLIGSLLGQVAALRAERAQLAETAPQSPQLPYLDGRIRAFEGQIEQERRRIAGGTNSLAGKLGEYEDLVLDREAADKALMQARAAADSAAIQARRQQLYLQRVVEPNLAEKPTRPRRIIGILTVLASALALYGIGWLVLASIREHRQT